MNHVDGTMMCQLTELALHSNLHCIVYSTAASGDHNVSGFNNLRLQNSGDVWCQSCEMNAKRTITIGITFNEIEINIVIMIRRGRGFAARE